MMHAASPFDMLADTYDDDFTTSMIGCLQRNRVWTFLTPFLQVQRAPLRILEINCGTGHDAMLMARLGHEVIATDASGQMIRIAKERASGMLGYATVQFLVCPFDQLTDQFEQNNFDLVISNFGGLNCIPESSLAHLSKDLSLLLKPSGRLFFVLMGRCCIREIVHFSLRGDFKSAFRRFNQSVDFSVNGYSLSIFYYSPGNLRKIFSPLFSMLDKQPIGLFIPPSYFGNYYSGKTAHLMKLNNLEKKLGFSILSPFGDHFCVTFKKGGTPV